MNWLGRSFDDAFDKRVGEGGGRVARVGVPGYRARFELVIDCLYVPAVAFEGGLSVVLVTLEEGTGRVKDGAMAPADGDSVYEEGKVGQSRGVGGEVVLVERQEFASSAFEAVVGGGLPDGVLQVDVHLFEVIEVGGRRCWGGGTSFGPWASLQERHKVKVSGESTDAIALEGVR